MGEEWPGPGSSAFHRSRKRPANCSHDVPSPRGPRNCGQFSPRPAATDRIAITAIGRKRRAIVRIGYWMGSGGRGRTS